MEKLCKSEWCTETLCVHGHGIAWLYTLRNTGGHSFSICSFILQLFPVEVDINDFSRLMPLMIFIVEEVLGEKLNCFCYYRKPLFRTNLCALVYLPRF